jgi:hypothetical protein
MTKRRRETLAETLAANCCHSYSGGAPPSHCYHPGFAICACGRSRWPDDMPLPRTRTRVPWVPTITDAPTLYGYYCSPVGDRCPGYALYGDLSVDCELPFDHAGNHANGARTWTEGEKP